jgi:acyl-CoA thioester hydrolase
VTNRHTQTFTADPSHIDEMDHVNNAVWLQWVQAVATAHWEAVASPEHVATYVWFAVRHEIDYRGNIGLGESVLAETYLPAPPTRARFERRVDFTNADGKVIVQVTSIWAIIERASGRLVRIPKAVSDPFGPFGEAG